ncbi:MAG: glycosyltransferase [Candidatus Omnitrophica bacterium]|nr:glycosyltransferase [Candidatus Omnitrophota bacterium]
MNVLLVMSRLPYPFDTGAKIRTGNLIKALAGRHQIFLVAFGDEAKEREAVRVLEKYCRRVICVPPRRYGILRFMMNIFRREPYNVEKYSSPGMERKISQLLAGGKIELIHCDSVQVSRNVRHARGVPKILTEHNVESVIFRRYARRQKNPLKRLYAYLQWRKLRRYEFAMCREFDRCVTVSAEDARILTEQGQVPVERITVVPNGVDLAYFQAGRAAGRPGMDANSVVFTGSMDWLPNIDAVEYCVKRIMPLVWERVPHAKFYVVGRAPAGSLLRLAESEPRLVVTGAVDDVRPYVAAAGVFIVPLRIGGGTRLKILQALAMSKAVVSTRIGAEGIEVTQGTDIALADEPADFAGKVVELLESVPQRDALGRQGRALVRQRYAWEHIAQNLDRIWKETGAYEDTCTVVS